MLITKKILSLLALAVTFAVAPVQANVAMPAFQLPTPDPLPNTLNVRACVFDIAGGQGQIWNLAKDLALEAKKWNINAELRLYTDERVAAEDYKAGQCDMVTLSLLRAKQFNFVVGSIDAPGNLPNYEAAKILLHTLANPQFSKMAIHGPYQIVAIAPIGSIFVMVNDRQIDSIEKAAGKRVAVLEWDRSQSRMIAGIGAQPVPSDITNFAGKFNNGQVDIIAAPALAFKPLELYKGLGDKGAIFRFPLLIAHGAILIRRDKLLPQVPDLDARLLSLQRYALQFVDPYLDMIKRQEAEVPAKYWMDLKPEDNAKYQSMLREARLALTMEGVYSAATMNLLKRVRCRHEPSNMECSQHNE